MRHLVYVLLTGILVLLYTTPAAANIRFIEYDLPNGLHVILQEDHAAPLVAVSVMYHVGSKNEEPGRTGFADFMQHMLYNGGDTHSGEYNEMIQAAGGQSGGNTTQDRVFFYETLPSAQLGLGIWTEARRMSYTRMDKAALDEQRKIVKTEKYKFYTTPYAVRYNIVYENAFTSSPYRWNMIAKEQYADKATPEELTAFYKTYFVPNNATIVIAGDINEKYARNYIEKYFGDIPAGNKPIVHPTAPEPEHIAEKKIAFYDNVQLPAVIVAYHIPALGSPDYYGIQLLVKLLSNGNNSRLNNALVAQQKAQNISAVAIANEQPGLAMIMAVANTGVKPEDLEQSLLKEIDKLGIQVTEDEYKRTQNRVENDYVQDNQKLQVLVQNLATGYTFLHKTNLVNEEPDNYHKITRADLTRIAGKYFTKQNRLVVYYLPKSMQKK